VQGERESSGGAGSLARGRHLRQRQTEDALGFDRVRGARNIVKCSSGQGPKISVPIGEMGKNNDWNTACGRGQDADGSAEVAIGEFILAKDELKYPAFDKGSRIGQGCTKYMRQTQTSDNFNRFIALRGFGANNQHGSGV
jgi:hypothetical protein